MIEALNKTKIEYILYHLNHHFEMDNIAKHFVYDQIKGKRDKPFVLFPLSSSAISKDFAINNLPVLFPLSKDSDFFQFDKNNNLVFKHDLLKSAFYLLSGYQETNPFKGDHLGRFSYNDSIQKELSIVDKPVVNAYFKIIIAALKQFCSVHNISVVEKSFWGKKPYALFLTHDVDRIDKWTIPEVKKRIKMLWQSGFRKHWSSAFTAIRKLIFSQNPYWNFDWLKSIEKKLGVHSTWFFLPRGLKNIDAFYSFSEPRIINLVQHLLKEGDSIGLHGTYNSFDNPYLMAKELKKIETLSSNKIIVSRQHWLRFKYPDTLRILEQLGVLCDSTWGFSDHFGWRNSYCMPFRPYDLEQDRMMNIWELPLNAMDVTFFDYLHMSFEEAFEAINHMINQCKKYGGLFTLLWHNSFLDDDEFPGIRNFYIKILDQISKGEFAHFKIDLLNSEI